MHLPHFRTSSCSQKPPKVLDRHSLLLELLFFCVIVPCAIAPIYPLVIVPLKSQIAMRYYTQPTQPFYFVSMFTPTPLLREGSYSNKIQSMF